MQCSFNGTYQYQPIFAAGKLIDKSNLKKKSSAISHLFWYTLKNSSNLTSKSNNALLNVHGNSRSILPSIISWDYFKNPLKLVISFISLLFLLFLVTKKWDLYQGLQYLTLFLPDSRRFLHKYKNCMDGMSFPDVHGLQFQLSVMRTVFSNIWKVTCYSLLLGTMMVIIKTSKS